MQWTQKRRVCSKSVVFCSLNLTNIQISEIIYLWRNIDQSTWEGKNLKLFQGYTFFFYNLDQTENMFLILCIPSTRYMNWLPFCTSRTISALQTCNFRLKLELAVLLQQLHEKMQESINVYLCSHIVFFMLGLFGYIWKFFFGSPALFFIYQYLWSIVCK